MGQAVGSDAVKKIPPHVFFFVSAVFRYLGPAFSVILFASVSVLGVAWIRIATATIVFTVWRKPWRSFAAAGSRTLRNMLALVSAARRGLVIG